MSKFFKIASSAIAAVMMLTSGVVYAGAATQADCNTNCSGANCASVFSTQLQGCNNVKVITNLKDCNGCDVQSILNQLNCENGSCGDLQSLLNRYGCNNSVVNQPATEPAETQPATQPATAEPAETQPATQPTATQPAVTQPATQPTTVQPTTAPQTVTQPAQSSEFNQAYEDEVIRLVNIERAKYGLSALTKRADATQAAEIRAKEITQSFSHTRPNGTSCFTVAGELGISYKSVGENIAYGYSTPAEVVNGWMNSEGHRKNILSASFNGIGVGCYKSGNVLYWSQFFIGA